jgi:hypothetical protein
MAIDFGSNRVLTILEEYGIKKGEKFEKQISNVVSIC